MQGMKLQKVYGKATIVCLSTYTGAIECALGRTGVRRLRIKTKKQPIIWMFQKKFLYLQPNKYICI